MTNRLPVLLAAALTLPLLSPAASALSAAGSDHSDHDHAPVYYYPGDGTYITVQDFEAPRKWDVDRNGATLPVAGVGATVTYSFVTSSTVEYDETGIGGGSGPVVPISSSMPFGSDDAIRDAFSAWSAVADITFVEVPDSGNDFFGAGVDIRIGSHVFDGAFGTLAHLVSSSYSNAGLDDIAITTLAFDIAENWQLDSIGNGTDTFDVFQVAAHEIGHAIGLDHTGVGGSLMNPSYSEAFTGLQADDIAGAVFLYGPAIPEPGTVMMVMVGLSATLIRRRAA